MAILEFNHHYYNHQHHAHHYPLVSFRLKNVVDLLNKLEQLKVIESYYFKII